MERFPEGTCDEYCIVCNAISRISKTPASLEHSTHSWQSKSSGLFAFCDEACVLSVRCVAARPAYERNRCDVSDLDRPVR